MLIRAGVGIVDDGWSSETDPLSTLHQARDRAREGRDLGGQDSDLLVLSGGSGFVVVVVVEGWTVHTRSGQGR